MTAIPTHKKFSVETASVIGTTSLPNLLSDSGIVYDETGHTTGNFHHPSKDFPITLQSIASMKVLKFANDEKNNEPKNDVKDEERYF